MACTAGAPARTTEDPHMRARVPGMACRDRPPWVICRDKDGSPCVATGCWVAGAFGVATSVCDKAPNAQQKISVATSFKMFSVAIETLCRDRLLKDSCRDML